MTLPITDQLDQVPHAELLALVKVLIAEVGRLQEENRQLRVELEKLRRPPTNSRNSSQPPSRDQKSQATEGQRDKLLPFLYYPEVPPTNNQSEQALRPSVIHRKVTNGLRSEWGAQAYADLQSIIATAKLKGQKVFELLINLMGTPVLYFLEASSP